ncbi:MAG: TonB-dependent receptor [Acidobacteria bacterium]|nr:MAG: TonB-dependent receptor [Acidobacteriota bacterium]
MKKVILVILHLFFLSVAGWAQTVAVSQISGTVKDQSGALLPGVEVKVTQTETAYTRTVVTNESGAYALPNLPVGPYRLEAALPGFSTYVQTGIVLQVNTNPAIHVVLSVGAVSEQIEVQADAAMVETRSTGIGQVINQEQVLELPLNGRQVSQLITLSGAANDFVPTSAGQSLVSNKNYPTVSAFSIAGGQGGQTLFLVDGGINMDPVSNVGLPLPFPDALREFKVETSSLPANYGTQPGGVVNVVTKSGTNQFHGAGFEFLRNYALNARNFFAPRRDSLKRHQFGGVIGGPIVKDKLFFFAGYQGTYEKVSPAANINFVHTAATLQGDFTGIAACAGRNLNAPFQGNRVDPSFLNPVALKLLAMIPTANDPCGRIVYGIPNSNHENQFVGRGDWQVNPQQSLFTRYFFTDYQHAPYLKDNLLTMSTDASVGLKDRVQTVVFGHTFVINTNTLSSLRAGFSRASVIRYSPDKVPTPAQLGASVTQAVPNYLFFNVQSYFAVSCQNCSPGPWVSNNWQLSEDLNLVRGAHQISIGGNWVHSQLNAFGNFSRNGNFTFNGQFSGNALADFMLGRPSSFTQNNGQVGAERLDIPSLYVQDNIRLNSHLTANVGLRWDPYLAPYQAEHHASIFDMGWYNEGRRSKVFPNAPAGTLFDGDEGMPGHSYYFGSWGKFAPRLGLIFDPRGKGQETIRAGYGIFYGITPLFLQNGTHAPWANPVNIPSPVGGLSNPYQEYPGGNPYPVPSTLPATTQFPTFGGGLGVFKLHPEPTYMEQWNLALQKQLADDWMVSATYLGNRTLHLQIGEALNSAVYIPGNCAAGTYGLTAAGACSNTANINFRRRLYLANPSQAQYYSGLTNFGDGGNANYNGLLLSVQHRFGHNYSLTANHTWSHCLNENEVALNGGGSGQDPDNRHGEYGNCLSDRQHAFNLTAVVRTPTFSRTWMQKLLGNWQESTIFTKATGTPSSASLGTDNSLTGGGDRPNLVRNPTLSEPTISRWLDTSAFVRPAVGTYGNSGRGVIRGPGAWNVDVALSRTFPITEAQKIDLRFEAFNLFNHTRFGNPNTIWNSPTFGQILTARDPRIMQVALKYAF